MRIQVSNCARHSAGLGAEKAGRNHGIKHVYIYIYINRYRYHSTGIIDIHIDTKWFFYIYIYSVLFFSGRCLGKDSLFEGFTEALSAKNKRISRALVWLIWGFMASSLRSICIILWYNDDDALKNNIWYQYYQQWYRIYTIIYQYLDYIICCHGLFPYPYLVLYV